VLRRASLSVAVMVGALTWGVIPTYCHPVGVDGGGGDRGSGGVGVVQGGYGPVGAACQVLANGEWAMGHGVGFE